MEKLEFRPTKILLLFWILGAVSGCIPIGGIITAVCMNADISLTHTLAMATLIPLVVVPAYPILYFFTIRYELDDRYVTKTSGVLWKKRRSTPLEKITNLDVRQGPFERLLGYGKIWIFTPSTGAHTPEQKLVGVQSPHEMKRTVVERCEGARLPQAAASEETLVAQPTEVVSLLTDISNSLKNIEHSLSQKSNPHEDGA